MCTFFMQMKLHFLLEQMDVQRLRQHKIRSVRFESLDVGRQQIARDTGNDRLTALTTQQPRRRQAVHDVHFVVHDDHVDGTFVLSRRRVMCAQNSTIICTTTTTTITTTIVSTTGLLQLPVHVDTHGAIARLVAEESPQCQQTREHFAVGRRIVDDQHAKLVCMTTTIGIIGTINISSSVVMVVAVAVTAVIHRASTRAQRVMVGMCSCCTAAVWRRQTDAAAPFFHDACC